MLRFHINDQVLVILRFNYEIDYQNSDNNDNNDNLIIKWLPGVVTKAYNPPYNGLSYIVKMDRQFLMAGNLDLSKYSSMSVQTDDYETICEYSMENVIKLVDTEEVFGSKIKTSTKHYDQQYDSYLNIAMEIGNIVSLNWLYKNSPRCLSSLESKITIIEKILLNGAKWNNTDILVWVKDHHPKSDEASWFSLFKVKDENHRNIFHIALAIEGHSNFLSNLIVKIYNRSYENDKNWDFITTCISAIIRNIDIDHNSCLHLAALNGKIMVVMNIIYKVWQLTPRWSCAMFDKIKDVPFNISNKNNKKETVSDIVNKSDDTNLIKEFEVIVSSIKMLARHDAVMYERADLFRHSRPIPFLLIKSDLSDMEYDSMIFDILIDQSITAEKYFESNIIPVIRNGWVSYISLFETSLDFGHWNICKLLLKLGLVHSKEICTILNEVGRNPSEIVCYGSWWNIRDKTFIKDKSLCHHLKIDEISQHFIEWDHKVFESVRHSYKLFDRKSLWEILDEEKHSMRERDDRFVDYYTDYKDIRPRGYTDMLQWLVCDCNCLYPSLKFILEECDKFMSEWFIVYRLTLNKILKEKFGDLYQLISSFLFTDYNVCGESILKEVVSLPTKGNNEKCVYLIDILISKFHVDLSLKSLQNSETILHLSIQNQQFLCSEFFLSKFKNLIYIESKEDKLLPFHFALQIATEDEYSASFLSYFISQYREIHTSSGAVSFTDCNGYYRPVDKESMNLLLDMEDSQGRKTKTFALESKNSEMKLAASLTTYPDIYNNLTSLIEEDAELNVICEFCEESGGREILEKYNEKLMDFANYDDRHSFGSKSEQEFLYSCLSKGRLNVIQWYIWDMYANSRLMDSDSFENILHWRFNSKNKNDLNGRGIFHESEYRLKEYFAKRDKKSSGNNELPSKIFFESFSAIDIANYYNQIDIVNYISDMKLYLEEEQKINDYFRESNEELYMNEGLRTNPGFAQNSPNLRDTGFRAAVSNGLSIVEIQSELDKGVEMKMRFRSTLKLEKSKVQFDHLCDVFKFYILNNSKLYGIDDWDYGAVLRYCIIYELDHVVKWIIEKIPIDYDLRSTVLSYCMTEAITFGRMSIIDYILSEGVSVNDTPIKGKENPDEDLSSYTMIAACSLEFDVFIYFYEHPQLINRPDVDSILISCIKHERMLVYNCGYFWHTENEMEILSSEKQLKHRELKGQNRKKIFQYFERKGSLNFNSNIEIVGELVRKISNTYLFEMHETLRNSKLFYAEQSFELLVYIVDEIGIDTTKSQRWGWYDNEQPSIRDLFDRKKKESKLVNTVEKGESIVELERLESELLIDICHVKRRQGGLPMLYLASIMKHSHIVKWLLETKPQLNLEEVDSKGRTAEVIAKIMKLDHITALFNEHKRKIKSSIIIQNALRRYRARKDLLSLRQSSIDQYDVWTSVVNCLFHLEVSCKLKPLISAKKYQPWGLLKSATKQVELHDEEEGDEMEVTKESKTNDLLFPQDDVMDDFTSDHQTEISFLPSSSTSENIKLTESALAWTRRMKNSLLLEVFQNRLLQLASGSRSYCLSKRLKYCRSSISDQVVYETKLDKGQRILWTESYSRGSKSIVVWYVSTHDKVPYHIGLMEESFRRGSEFTEYTSKNNNTLAISTVVPNVITKLLVNSVGITKSESNILIDPKRNNILITYTIQPSQLHFLRGDSNWIPPMTLTEEEIDIVSTDRSVLLLGRSGTGKTVCLLSRMLRDRVRSCLNPLKQLFVCYTENLCSNIKLKFERMDYRMDGSADRNYNNDNNIIQFTYIANLMSGLLAKCKDNNNNNEHRFLIDMKINYSQFRDEFWPKLFTATDKKIMKRLNFDLDPLTVWTHIRSFIKGSIEAIINNKNNRGSYLELSQYLDDKEFGLSRCKIERDREEIKRVIYKIYENYQIILSHTSCWDDMDLVASVFSMLHSYYERKGSISTALSDTKRQKIVQINISPEIRLYDRIYCDEVQDMTQSEIGVLLTCVGFDHTAIFFTGDTAQTIACGVDFRFEEVRSCIFKMSGGDKKKGFDSVVTLTKSLRSHDGVLKVGNVVLHKLFEAFPLFSDRVPAETGLCFGPKPALMKFADDNELISFCQDHPRLKVLTWDECLDSLSERLGGSAMVLGIRQVKGLEFSDVAIVDFFKSKGVVDEQNQPIQPKNQKAWKSLLSSENSERNNLSSYPAELEIQLKILYTAVTRCSARLLFVETAASLAGTAWFEYLCKHNLAQKVDPDAKLSSSSGEEMEKNRLILADEWHLRGLEVCVSADEECSRGDYTAATQALQQAVQCFRRYGDRDLCDRASNQLLGVQMHAELKKLMIHQKEDVNSNLIENAMICSLTSKIVCYYLESGKFSAAMDLCESAVAVATHVKLLRNIARRIAAVKARIQL